MARTCPRCGYDLTGIEPTICPECGQSFDPEELRFFWRARSRAHVAVLKTLSGLAALGLLLILRIALVSAGSVHSTGYETWGVFVCFFPAVIMKYWFDQTSAHIGRSQAATIVQGGIAVLIALLADLLGYLIP
jgi:hypothetical protein